MNKIEPDEGYEERLKSFLQKNNNNSKAVSHKRFSVWRIFRIAIPVTCAFAIIIGVTLFSSNVMFKEPNGSFSSAPSVANILLNKSDYVVKGKIMNVVPPEKYVFAISGENNRTISVTASKIIVTVETVVKGELASQTMSAFIIPADTLSNSDSSELTFPLPESGFLETNSNYLLCLNGTNSNITVQGEDTNPLFLVDGINGIFKQKSTDSDIYKNIEGSIIYEADLSSIAMH
jgi:hypothetical protein